MSSTSQSGSAPELSRAITTSLTFATWRRGIYEGFEDLNQSVTGEWPVTVEKATVELTFSDGLPEGAGIKHSVIDLMRGAAHCEPALPTSPWMPKELFEHEPFVTALGKAVTEQLAQERSSRAETGGMSGDSASVQARTEDDSSARPITPIPISDRRTRVRVLPASEEPGAIGKLDFSIQARNESPCAITDLANVANRKRHGRKTKFTQEQLDLARGMKSEGESNNDIAKLLYGTLTPTRAQRRSVPTTLKHHFGSKK